MGAYQLHKHEWWIALFLLVAGLFFRLDKAVRDWNTRARNASEIDFYKNAHQVDMVKAWVTSQYCRIDLEILCPEDTSTSHDGCYSAFDPPVRYVLDLTAGSSKDDARKDCSLRELIDHTKWSDKADANDLKEDELLVYFFAHILEQVRTKSVANFRAEDRNIPEYEQSRLIEGTLTSLLHLFTSPTKMNGNRETVATRATEFGISGKVWTKEEVITQMHEAVLWHTHHKRHGSSTTGAALRLSRQKPSFLLRYLPLVKEQIQALEVDDAWETRYQNLYPFHKLHSQTLALNSDQPQSDRCLWSHYEEGTLITRDCMLALGEAPLKVRALDWEGNFSLILVYMYTCFSGAFAVWIFSRARRQQQVRKNTTVSDEMTPVQPLSTRSLEALSNRSLKAASTRSLKLVLEVPDSGIEIRKSDQIRSAKRLCVAYFGLSNVLAFVSSWSSEAINFSDFYDGMCLVLLGFLSLRPLTLGACQSMEDKRKALLDPINNKHYKKFASIEFTESC